MIEGLNGVEPGGLLVLPETYDDLIEQLRDPGAAGISEEADTEVMRTGDILVAKGQAERSEVERVADVQGDQPIGQALIQQGVAKASEVAGAIPTQQKIQGRQPAEATVRVGTGRLDSLIDAVGELVIAQSMVAQDSVVTDGENQQLSRNVSHAGKIVRELQDVSMSLRMVPLKATFGKMARLVRDLARKAGKKVNFVTEGEDTEIDRNMVEVLSDPLVHMMRNAVDHGIEMPERRAEAGKDPAGTVRLRAYHSAGNIVIELQDDGKGLDREKILAKAIERGLINPGDDLSDAEAFGLIFQAGFSTAEKVTDVSGRGVGMDVVKNGIESLRGRIDIESAPGQGSTFTIQMPLTMAIAAGKNCSCEKPIAGTLKAAREMAAAAKTAKVKTFVWYNYRRAPAVALAHMLVRRGKIGKIRHVRAKYLQDWADESVPLAWRFDKKLAGSGAHGDLNAHIIDMTRFVTGEEITEISGAIAETFIKRRKLMTGVVAGGIAGGLKSGGKTGPVTVDDCVLFLARFSGGAVASFEAARQATGNQNANGFEINGTKGSIKFNFERMNELEYYDATADRATQGWTTIMCTHAPDHPYVDAWWPDAHPIGYEHCFVNQAYDILRVLAGQKPTVPIPDFQDAYQTQRVLEAALLSAKLKKPIKLKDVK